MKMAIKTEDVAGLTVQRNPLNWTHSTTNVALSPTKCSLNNKTKEMMPKCQGKTKLLW